LNGCSVNVIGRMFVHNFEKNLVRTIANVLRPFPVSWVIALVEIAHIDYEWNTA